MYIKTNGFKKEKIPTDSCRLEFFLSRSSGGPMFSLKKNWNQSNPHKLTIGLTLLSSPGSTYLKRIIFFTSTNLVLGFSTVTASIRQKYNPEATFEFHTT